MNKLKPAEIQKRERSTRNFDKYWEINCGTLEIKHRPLKGLVRITNLFWKRRFKVSDMYWWSARKLDSTEGIAFKNAIKHDDIPIKNFPRKHQIENGWSISAADLKYLYDGPLVDSNGQLLVDHQSKIQKFVSLLTQLRPLSYVIMFALFCMRYKEEIARLFELS